MSALQYNIRMQQGVAYKKVIRWLDAQGNPKPIAGWTGHMQIKSAYGQSGFLLDMRTDNGEIQLSPGYIILQLSNARTRSLPVDFKTYGPSVQTYFYDLFIYDLTGGGRCFMEGNVFVKGALTNAL